MNNRDKFLLIVVFLLIGYLIYYNCKNQLVENLENINNNQLKIYNIGNASTLDYYFKPNSSLLLMDKDFYLDDSIYTNDFMILDKYEGSEFIDRSFNNFINLETIKCYIINDRGEFIFNSSNQNIYNNHLNEQETLEIPITSDFYKNIKTIYILHTPGKIIKNMDSTKIKIYNEFYKAHTDMNNIKINNQYNIKTKNKADLKFNFNLPNLDISYNISINKDIIKDEALNNNNLNNTLSKLFNNETHKIAKS